MWRIVSSQSDVHCSIFLPHMECKGSIGFEKIGKKIDFNFLGLYMKNNMISAIKIFPPVTRRAVAAVVGRNIIRRYRNR
jgi:hypothetical protein